MDIEMTQSTNGGRSGSVQSVERVFEILEAIADAGGQASLSDLASSLGLPLPTIHRLLKTCVGLGYVRQLPSRRYGLGAKLIPLGEVAGRQLGSSAQSQLRQLVETLGETANVSMLDGDRVVYVAQQPSPHAMRMFTEVGRRVHLHDTGAGKAILATLPDSRVAQLVGAADLPTPTGRSHSTLESLLADLIEIRRRGYSVDDEEQELGVRCVAVAVPDSPAPMAVSVSGPTQRVDAAFAERAAPVLFEVAERISAALQD